MPLFKIIEEKGILIGVWQVSETRAHVLDMLKSVNPKELNTFSIIKNEKVLVHRVCSRLVLYELLKLKRTGLNLKKDEFGKLHLLNKRGGQASLRLSISHCHGWAAAIIGDRDVGIDIEILNDRASRIKYKFCNSEELNRFVTHDDLTFCWGAKEAIYKAYGRKQLIFAKDMKIHHPDRATLHKNGAIFNYAIYRNNDLVIDDNVQIVYAVLE